jgi:hypothetical protein
MNRTNIILLAVLAAAAGLYVGTRESDEDRNTGPAPKLFPEFNAEAVDQIEISGGWEGTKYVFTRLGSQWALASGGGYVVKNETVNNFVDAVANLRKDAVVGTSEDLQASTRTNDEGRLIRVLTGETAMAEFRVGKNPKQAFDTFFVRKEGDSTVYRTRTLLPKDLENMSDDAPNPAWNRGPSGVRWNDYTQKLADWVETRVWTIKDAETQAVQLKRKDKYEVTISRAGNEAWELKEAGQDKAVPADTDAAQGFADDLRYLSFTDVLGRYEQVNAEYGLDNPDLTLVLTLKQKIEKKDETPPPADDGEKKDGDGEKKDEEKKDEFKLIKRIVEVGKKIERAESIDDATGEVKKENYYAVHVGGDFDDPQVENRANFVFLVDAITLRALFKELDELKQPEPEKKPEEEKPGEDQPETPPEEKPAEEPTDAAKPEDKPETDKPKDDAAPKSDEPKDAEKPADDKPADDKPADDKPADDKPADDKPK